MNRKFSLILLFILFFVLLETINSATAEFSDVASNHPYRAAIDYVQEQNIVRGYPDGTFQPNRLINRAEFTKIIVGARYSANEINTCINTPEYRYAKIFNDVDKGVWFEDYVCLSKKEEIIGGYPDKTFRPTQSIIFAEAAKIIINGYGYKTQASEPWFKTYLDKLEALDAIPESLISVSDFVDRGMVEITRGEMAEIIFRLREEENVVASSDGSFAIKLPESALPEGMPASAISIRRLEAHEAPVEEVNGAPMIFYNLEPPGIKFQKPVTFEIETLTVANIIPMIFLVSEDSIEMLQNPIIEIDKLGGAASLTAQLSHFSFIAIGIVDLFNFNRATITPPGDQLVSMPFAVNFDMSRRNAISSFSITGTDVTITILENWKLLDGLFTDVGDALIPQSIYDVPSLKEYIGAESYTVSRNFTCNEESTSEAIRYQVNIGWEYEITRTNSTETREAVTTAITTTDPFKCLPLVPGELVPNLEIRGFEEPSSDAGESLPAEGL